MSLRSWVNKQFGAMRQKKYGGYWEQMTTVPPMMEANDYVQSYGQIGWLYACVTKRADAVASASMHLYRLDGESNRTEIFSHPLLQLLNKPNPYMTGYKLDMLTGIYMDLIGEAFWVVERDARNNPIELWPVNPAYMWIVPDEEEYIKGWVYRCGSKNVPIDPRDVVHFYFPNPDNPYRGIGPAQAASVDIQCSQFANEWNRRFFYNSARPDALIEFDRTLDEDEYNQIVEHWKASHSGVDNAHKIGMLEIGHYKQISTTPKDMDFSALHTLSRDSILSIFGVPKSILGITEDVNRATAETAEYTFAKRTVKPLLRMREDDLNAQYLPLFRDERLLVEYDDPTPEDRTAVLAERTAGYNRWLTVNEIREQYGLEPVEGGDVLPPQGYSFPAIDFGTTDETAGDESGAKLLVSARPMMPKSKVMVQRKQLVSTWRKGLDREAYWKSFVTKTDTREQKLAKTWKSIFAYQRREISAAMERYGKSIETSDGLLLKMRAYFDKKSGKDEMDQLLGSLDDIGKDSQIFKSLRPMIAQMMGESAEEWIDDTGIGIQFDLRNPKVAKWIDKFCAAQIKSINATTRDQLKAAIGKAEADGLSIPDIKEQISGLFDQISDGRLNTIVRTEVIGASNAGTLAGYEQSGVVEGKEWLAAIDERTRPLHAEADGQKVAIDGEFMLGDGTEGECPGNMGSAEHDINCRCTVLPVV